MKLLVIGEQPLEEEDIEELKRRMPTYHLGDMQLRILQSSSGGGAIDPEMNKATLQLMNQMEESSQRLDEKDKRIIYLEQRLTRMIQDTIPIVSIGEEVGTLFPELERLAYAPTVSSDLRGGSDTLDIFLVRWRDNVSQQTRKAEEAKLSGFLKKRIDSEELQIIDVE